MAIIGTYKLAEYEQEEIIEIQQIAGEDGVVEEVTTLIQPYAHTWVELIIEQKPNVNKNLSYFTAELVLHAEAGAEGDGFSFQANSYTGQPSKTGVTFVGIKDGGTTFYFEYQTSGERNGFEREIFVEPGTSTSKIIGNFSAASAYSIEDGLVGAHTIDGTFATLISHSSYINYMGATQKDLIFGGCIDYDLKNLLISGEIVDYKTIKESFNNIAPTPLNIDRGIYPITADNFTDENDPALTYTVETKTGCAYIYYMDGGLSRNNLGKDSLVSMQVALSLDGETIDIEYRDLAIDGTNYTFDLTEEERELLRQKAQGSSTVPIYYIIKSVRNVFWNLGTPLSPDDDYSETVEIISKTQRNFTIVGCNPSLNPIVKDIKPETLALTGDENTFIRYESMAEFAINATASKHATIVSQSVQCGSVTITDLPNGVIDDTESGTFIFNVTDSRNMGASASVFKNLVEYVKPTCYQKLEIEITGETGAIIKLTTNGNYYNGSFGVVDNELTLQARYKENNGEMGEWQALSGTPTFNGTTYELEATFTNFNYGSTYTFQTRAIDKLNTVVSSEYVIRMLPVFDWSETDFNFNVPVNIDAEDLSMHGETIIRHSDSTNNTVLSATGGHIYLRPGGTDDTSGQTILYNNGNIDISGNTNFGGTVNFSSSFTIGGYILNDYVIETGSEAMGSNGTWYWQKWLSGKAECWGCRNFGSMATTTAWGSLYRSAVFTQDLPDGVFVRTPDAININFVHATGAAWICKHENTAPSAVTTGSFVVVCPTSGNISSPTNIGFHIIGEWY